MKSVIERVKKLHDEYGEDLFVKNYNISSGHVFLFNKTDLSLEDYVNIDSLKKNNIIPENIEEINTYGFYEGCITANKAVFSKTKFINSVTPYSFIIGYSNLKKYFSKEDTSREYLEIHAKALVESFGHNLDVSLYVDKMVMVIDSIFKKIEEEGLKLKNDDKIRAFIREDISLYKEAYHIYLNERIFTNNDYIIEYKGVKYGPPAYAVTFNSKKITFGSNPYGKSSYMLSLEDSKLLYLFMKIKTNKIMELLNNEQEIKIDVNFDLNNISKVKEFSKIEESKDIKQKVYPYKEFKLISSNCIESIDSEKTRADILYMLDTRIIDRIFNYSDKKTSTDNQSLYLLRNLIKKDTLDKEDIKQLNLRLNDNNLSSLLVTNKGLFTNYFNHDSNLDIKKPVRRLILNVLRKGYVKNIDFFKARYYLDNAINILNFIGGGVDIMNLAKIKSKLIDLKQNGTIEDFKEYIIESDIEFVYLAGQIYSYIRYIPERAKNTKENSKESSKEYTKSQKIGLMSDAFDKRTFNEIKRVILDRYNKYSYDIDKNNVLLNKCVQCILEYGLGENTKMTDELTFIFQAGLIGDNFLFIKSNKFKEEDKEDV